MTTLLAVVGALITVGGLVGAVIYYLRRSAATAADLGQADATLQVEQQRRAQLEAARTAEESRAAKEFDDKAAAVATATDAARLLHDAFASVPPGGSVPSDANPTGPIA